MAFAQNLALQILLALRAANVTKPRGMFHSATQRVTPKKNQHRLEITRPLEHVFPQGQVVAGFKSTQTS